MTPHPSPADTAVQSNGPAVEPKARSDAALAQGRVRPADYENLGIVWFGTDDLMVDLYLTTNDGTKHKAESFRGTRDHVEKALFRWITDRGWRKTNALSCIEEIAASYPWK